MRRILLMVFFCMTAALTNAQFASDEDKQTKSEAIALANEGKKQEAVAKMNTIKDQYTKLSTGQAVIEGLFEYGSKKEAMALAEQQLDSIWQQVASKKVPPFQYSNMAVPYARFLMKKGLAKQAYPLMKNVMDQRDVKHYSTAGLYAECLVKTSRYDEAVTTIQTMIIDGAASPYVIDTLYREAYLRLSGRSKGFELQRDSVLKVWKRTVKDSVVKKMIHREAIDFVLPDAEGKQWRLSDLKGKTVVIDFWANWCMPCKASFPAMKLAQDRFKGDNSVVFLFIHTMERGETDPVPEAVKYMKDNGFDFQVLFDLRDKQTKQSPVSKSYDVRGIPMKFIIDPAGFVRYETMGGTKLQETEAMAAEHIVAMVETARDN